jgi:Acetylornithine deacetylase/Succinyl-diaminopimelate desuccinylase and related deacylases
LNTLLARGSHMTDKKTAFWDDSANQVIEWQRELTCRPAIGPESGGQGEEQKAAWITAELGRLGLAEIRQYPCDDARVACGFRPNISASIPGKLNTTLWVVAHMDVVPPGDISLWDSPPFETRVDGDHIFGRGVEDNQQAIVSGMLAAQYLLTNGITPDIGLGLLFVADEETGMHRGMPHVLETAPELFGKGDMFLVPDMGNNIGNMIEIAEKSCLWLRITVTGKQCHASTPELGVNSLVAASACVLELESLYRQFSLKNPLFTPSWSTFVPSKKEANVENINTLPGKDVFYLDCRILPEYQIGAVEHAVTLIAADVAARYHTDISVEVVHREQAPEATDTRSPVVARLASLLQRKRGLTPIICGAGGQTIAAVLRRKGFPTAVWATLMPNPHVPNECSSISATIADAEIVVGMLAQGDKWEH